MCPCRRSLPGRRPGSPPVRRDPSGLPALGVVDQRPRGDLHLEILTAPAGPVARPPTRRSAPWEAADVEERVDVGGRVQDHAPAAAAVAAVGPSARAWASRRKETIHRRPCRPGPLSSSRKVAMALVVVKRRGARRAPRMVARRAVSGRRRQLASGSTWTAAGLEADGAVDQGVEGVVASDADVLALLVLRTTTNEDGAGGDLLATEALTPRNWGWSRGRYRSSPVPSCVPWDLVWVWRSGSPGDSV